MNLDILEKYIMDLEIEQAVILIEELGNNKDKDTAQFLIKHFKDTNSHVIRNAIAIALADIGSDLAIEPIVCMLKDPKTVGARGTLLYALESFNCSLHFDNIIDLLFEDNYEVSRQTLLLLELNAKEIPEQKKNICQEKIEREIEKVNDKLEFLIESLEIITGEEME